LLFLKISLVAGYKTDLKITRVSGKRIMAVEISEYLSD
jgi:hypothetical protein